MPEITDPRLLAELGGAPPPAAMPRAPGGLVPIGPPIPRRPPDPPSGYEPAPGGLRPTPGGPADPNKPDRGSLPQGWERGPDGVARPIPGLPATVTDPKTADPKLTESENTAAFLATRVAGGIKDINTALRGNPAANKPGVGATVAGVFGDEARNWANSPARRQIENAQLDVLDAALTLGTGAAYTPDQLQNYRKAYFPTLTDDPKTIAAKQLRLRRLLEAAKLKAGKAAPQIDEALAAIGGMQEGEEPEIDPETGLMVVPIVGGRRSPPPDDDILVTKRDLRPLGIGLGGVAEAVGDTLGVVSNPFNAGVNWLTGSNLSTDMGESLRNTLGLPNPENNTERLINAINYGGTSALGLAGAARAAVPMARGALQSGLSRFAASPLTDMLAGSSGATGAELARQSGAGPVGQVAAGLLGGGASLPVSAGINALARPRMPQVQTPLTRAGQAEGVTVNRAMVDPDIQNRVTGVEATMAGGPIVRRNMNAVGGQIERRVNALGQGGQAMEPNVAGQTVQRAGERYIKNSGKTFKQRYDALDKETTGLKLPPNTSLSQVDGIISKLSETPGINQKEIAYLQSLRGDLEKDLSVGALRRMRTKLRKDIAKGELTFGESEADVLSVMNAASEDIAAGLAAAGKGGLAKRFRQVDADYRDRMTFINGTVQKLVGRRNANLPPEKVFANFKAMASPKGDNAGLARMIRLMEPEEQADIAATFADALGKNGKGDFSTAHFLSQVEKLPPAARANLFGPDGAKSIENLRVLAKEHARVMGGLNNSRTGVANDWRSGLLSIVFGSGAGILTESGVKGLAAAAGVMAAKGSRDAISARLLMSTDVQKWLRTAPRTSSPKAISAHIDRLKAIATREPALAGQIEQLQQAAMRAANDNVRAAAAGSSDKKEQQRR